ncbi:drosomycin-like [Drosophila bipectinata]|uniref:drosomycin-like n=1 Tax=Drosophila bipectinata TaxID=42026 RepID=UPI001C8992C2|nr:drosomycin-like [Drosophila bipectinata]
MVQIKFLYFLFAVMALVVLGGSMAQAECLSSKYKGPCAVWDMDRCKRLCKEEGRPSGHCSGSLKCWCESC